MFDNQIHSLQAGWKLNPQLLKVFKYLKKEEVDLQRMPQILAKYNSNYSLKKKTPQRQEIRVSKVNDLMLKNHDLCKLSQQLKMISKTSNLKQILSRNQSKKLEKLLQANKPSRHLFSSKTSMELVIQIISKHNLSNSGNKPFNNRMLIKIIEQVQVFWKIRINKILNFSLNSLNNNNNKCNSKQTLSLHLLVKPLSC